MKKKIVQYQFKLWQDLRKAINSRSVEPPPPLPLFKKSNSFQRHLHEVTRWQSFYLEMSFLLGFASQNNNSDFQTFFWLKVKEWTKLFFL